MEILCSSLEGSTNEENDGTDQDSHLSTKLVTNGAGEECAEEGTTSEHTDDSTSLVGIGVEFPVEGLGANGSSNDTEIITVKY